MIDEAALNEEEVLLWAPGDENDDVWDDTELIKVCSETSHASSKYKTCILLSRTLEPERTSHTPTFLYS